MALLKELLVNLRSVSVGNDWRMKQSLTGKLDGKVCISMHGVYYLVLHLPYLPLWCVQYEWIIRLKLNLNWKWSS